MRMILNTPTSDELRKTGMECAEIALKTLRKARLYPGKMKICKKKDGTLITQYDVKIEKEIRKIMNKRFPMSGFIGEEFGGEFGCDGIQVAVDPIDGTNSFISHDKTNAFSLSIFENGRIRFGIVANPATGEIFHAVDNEKTTLRQLGFLGEDEMNRKLPSCRKNYKSIMIDLQNTPFSDTRSILEKAKDDGLIKTLKSSKGSPALSIAEAAKGHYIYICDWHDVASFAYDISAGYKIIKNAGGYMMNIETGEEIDPVGFKGTLIAGTDKEKLMKVIGRFMNNF